MDGKRFIKIHKGANTPALTLEYSLNAAELKVKGAVIDDWQGWKIDLSREITFKP